MTDTDPTKRIPKSLGTDAKVLGNYAMADVAVAVLPAVAIVIATQVVVPPGLELGGVAVQSLTLPLAAVGLFAGSLVVFLTPAHAASTDWVLTLVSYLGRNGRRGHHDASEQTLVRRVHPEADAIERLDGTFVGVVRVDPPTMGLATDAEWTQLAGSFEDFLNTTVEFPVQLYSKPQSFPVETYLDHYRSRLDDPDVADNPQLARLVESYIDWYREERQHRQLSTHEHYVVVPVRPREVQFGDGSLLGRLARAPYLGLFIDVVYGPTRGEQRAALVETLADRCHRVETGLREIEGCSTHRLSVEDAMGLVRAFWTGREDDPDLGSLVRTTPLAGGQARE